MLAAAATADVDTVEAFAADVPLAAGVDEAAAATREESVFDLPFEGVAPSAQANASAYT